MTKSKAQARRPEGRGGAVADKHNISGDAGAKRADGRPIGKPFQPGQSGNPEGKPKGLRNSKTILTELLSIIETVTDADGIVHEVDQLEMMWAKQAAQAKRGDGYSLDRILSRIEDLPVQKTSSVNLNVNTSPTGLDDLTDDQIARIAAIAKESSNG